MTLNQETCNLYVYFLLSEVEQEERPSRNRDREAIVVGAGLCDGEGERAYTVFDPILGEEKYLNFLKRFKTLCMWKTYQDRIFRSRNFRSIFDLAFRSHKNSIQKYPIENVTALA